MTERYYIYPYYNNKPNTMTVYSETTILDRNDHLVNYPIIDDQQRYVIRTIKNNWLLMFDTNGLFYLNPALIFDFSYQWVVQNYLNDLFGLDVSTYYRYNKYRIYIYTPSEVDKYDLEHPDYRWISVHRHPAVKRYIVPEGALQKEPIVFGMRGEFISGAIRHERKIYTSEW
jgi:hypothetical protein